MEFKQIQVAPAQGSAVNRTDILSFYYVVARRGIAACKIKCILRHLIQPKQITLKEIVAEQGLNL